jgi:hypothetical protein
MRDPYVRLPPVEVMDLDLPDYDAEPECEAAGEYDDEECINADQ